MDRIYSPRLDRSITTAIRECGKCKNFGPTHLHSLLEPIYTWGYMLKTHGTAKTTVDGLDKIRHNFRAPESLMTDGGKHFNNEEFSPKELLLGLVVNTPRMPTSRLSEPALPTETNVHTAYVAQQRLDAADHTVAHALKCKAIFDRRVHRSKAREVLFSPGQLVQVYANELDSTFKTSRKIIPQWSAPRRIATRRGNSYTLATLEGFPIPGFFHAHRLRHFYPRTNSLLADAEKEEMVARRAAMQNEDEGTGDEGRGNETMGEDKGESERTAGDAEDMVTPVADEPHKLYPVQRLIPVLGVKCTCGTDIGLTTIGTSPPGQSHSWGRGCLQDWYWPNYPQCQSPRLIPDVGVKCTSETGINLTTLSTSSHFWCRGCLQDWYRPDHPQCQSPRPIPGLGVNSTCGTGIDLTTISTNPLGRSHSWGGGCLQDWYRPDHPQCHPPG
ncbi:hypothetical protein PAXINDRAFT_156255 [Paxillus involutus ATCC 200175]|uniref:Integrase catalytic domain-containing protein n=1 Tax=Paxillus involutus ATCC 200175 TaxID=664439 RepID=A0A0C9TEY8_PAXIN|nr:hypothetical protein PAXINDRAFT_156255 [Paxillus involutus ATCC 200175]